MKNDSFYVIQAFMINDLDLSGSELNVYAVIYGFSQDGESWFTGSRKYIAGCLNVSLPTVDKAIKGLADKGLIIVDHYYIESTKMNKYKVSLSAIETYKESLRGCKESLQGGVKILYRGSKESLQGGIKNLYTDNIDNNIKDNIVDNKEIPNNVQGVVDLYHTLCPSLPKVRVITNKRIKAIKSFLKQYDIETIKEAFEKAEASDFMKGNNNRGWKADIDFLTNVNNIAKVLEDKYKNKDVFTETNNKFANEWGAVK